MEKNNDRKGVFIGADNWPVEGIIGKPVKTFLRRLFLTRGLVRYETWRSIGGCEIHFGK